MSIFQDIVKTRILKPLLLILILFPIIFFLNTGFALESYWKITQSVVLAVALTLILTRPDLRITIFWVSLLLMIIMAIFFVVRLIDLAEMVGSTGFGLIIMNIISYLPQFIKLGYIKKI